MYYYIIVHNYVKMDVMCVLSRIQGYCRSHVFLFPFSLGSSLARECADHSLGQIKWRGYHLPRHSFHGIELMHDNRKRTRRRTPPMLLLNSIPKFSLPDIPQEYSALGGLETIS
jgi:hypothetical protein